MPFSFQQEYTTTYHRIRSYNFVYRGISVDSPCILWYNLDKTGIPNITKEMNTMRDYYEKLQTETNWFKLFVPYFLWWTLYLVVIFPIIKYIIEVLIRHKEYSGNNIGYAIAVSLFFSVVLSGIKSYGNRKKKKEEQ